MSSPTFCSEQVPLHFQVSTLQGSILLRTTVSTPKAKVTVMKHNWNTQAETGLVEVKQSILFIINQVCECGIKALVKLKGVSTASIYR